MNKFIVSLSLLAGLLGSVSQAAEYSCKKNPKMLECQCNQSQGSSGTALGKVLSAWQSAGNEKNKAIFRLQLSNKMMPGDKVRNGTYDNIVVCDGASPTLKDRIETTLFNLLANGNNKTRTVDFGISDYSFNDCKDPSQNKLVRICIYAIGFDGLDENTPGYSKPVAPLTEDDLFPKE